MRAQKNLHSEVAKLKLELSELLKEQDVDPLKAKVLLKKLRIFLNKGQVRAAHKINGRWQVEPWVVETIQLCFKFGTRCHCDHNHTFSFDLDTLPLKKVNWNDRIRVVPGGSSIRDGSYIGKGTVIMPPVFINIGAFIGEKSMIDSHVLVGSCAQIGNGVHIGTGSQIGGIIDPVGTMPVIVEDSVKIGGGCGIFGNVIIQSSVVVAAGTIITDHTPVYDLVRQTVYTRSEQGSLVIPHCALVVPGARAYAVAGVDSMISIHTPVIVKYNSNTLKSNLLITRRIADE